MDRLELGHKGETYIMDLFTRAQRNPVPAPRGQGDIVLDGGAGISLEVKSSLPGRSGRRRFQFCLRKVGRDGTVHTNARNADLTILLAYTDLDKDPTILAIPRARLNGGKSIKLPADLGSYDGKWSWFFGFDRALAEMRKGV